jgi:hypothetical protein
VASSAGVWLFYVQHQFEHTYWAWGANWNVHTGALHGSSHYDLPPVLRWFTANIGIHHIHHLASWIPCYRLGEALRDHPELRGVSRLTLKESFRCLRSLCGTRTSGGWWGSAMPARRWCPDPETIRFALRHRRRSGPPAERPQFGTCGTASSRWANEFRKVETPRELRRQAPAWLMQISRADRALG